MKEKIETLIRDLEIDILQASVHKSKLNDLLYTSDNQNFIPADSSKNILALEKKLKGLRNSLNDAKYYILKIKELLQ